MNLCSCDVHQTEPCKCSPTLPSPGSSLQLAIATVPMQPWETPYDPEKGLIQGTIFPSLDLPFFVTGGGIHA